MAKFKAWSGVNGYEHIKGFAFRCPGCDDTHQIWTANDPGRPTWQFNGDVDRPTVSPSILVTYTAADEPPERCHSFVRDGQIQFLGDCTHTLAGLTVQLPELEA